MKLVIATSLLALIACYTQAEEQTSTRWIDRKAEGYFWYHDHDEVESKKDETPPEVTPTQHSPIPPAKEEPKRIDFSTAWIRENLPKYMDQAIDNPTDENVTAYLLLQKRSMDKAFVFTDAVQMVAQSNPLLDPNNERPTAAFASKSLDALTSAKRDSLIQRISQNTALIYFMDNSDLTKIQNPIVDVIERNLDFALARIAVEPLDPSVSAGKAIKKNAGHNQQMNIVHYPALVLIRGDGVFDVIAQAPVSLSDFTQRTFMSAKRLGVISEDEFNSTRPLRNIATKNNVEAFVSPTPSVPVPSNQVINELNGR